MRTAGVLTLTLCVVVLCLAPTPSRAVEVLNVKTNGQPGYIAYQPTISRDGKWAAFSALGGLLAGEQGQTYDIYLRNLETGALERASLASNGSEANSLNQYPVLSDDGRYVAFVSYANNLVPGDTNNIPDVFVHDRITGTTEIVSIGTDGRQGTAISNGAAISGDGRYVAFNTVSKLSDADSSLLISIYVRDRQERTTTYIADGNYPAISSDGRFIAFRSWSQLLLYDRQTGTTETIADHTYDYTRFPANPYAYIPSISADGRYVTFEGWSAAGAPLSTEVFVYDRLDKSTRQITAAYDGTPLTTASCDYSSELKPQISADGRQVVYTSCAADIVAGSDGIQLYRYDMAATQTTRLEVDNLWALTYFPIFETSGDGSVVVFQDALCSHLATAGSCNFGIFSTQTGVDPAGGDDASAGDNGGAGDDRGSDDGAFSLVATPAVLWPPNGKMTDVAVTVPAAAGDTVELRVADEYGALNQVAYGKAVTVPLEAWRAGNDQDGRTYTLTATVTDGVSGQTRSASVVVSVPHDQH